MFTIKMIEESCKSYFQLSCNGNLLCYEKPEQNDSDVSKHLDMDSGILLLSNGSMDFSGTSRRLPVPSDVFVTAVKSVCIKVVATVPRHEWHQHFENVCTRLRF